MPVSTPYQVLVVGNPVLNTRSDEVTDVDGKFVKLCEDMFTTMYAAPGIGLAAPQIGVQKRFFVYDHDDEPGVVINPVIVETRGEAEFVEGCLSIPGLSFEIVRPAEIHVKGYDLAGNEIDLDLDDFAARVFQHEIDHLDGILMESHLTPEQLAEARSALRALRDRGISRVPEPEVGIGLRLP